MSFQASSGSLFGIDGEIKKQPEEELFYFIDFTKMSKVEDLILVLQSMGFGISDKHVHFEQVKGFLDLDKPIKMK